MFRSSMKKLLKQVGTKTTRVEWAHFWAMVSLELDG